MISSNKSDFMIHLGIKLMFNRVLLNINENTPRLSLGISIIGSTGLIFIAPFINVCVVGQYSI